MIKCTYFSKLLKLGLFTLLIGFFGFGLGSSVNAMSHGLVYQIGQNVVSDAEGSNINLSVLPKGAVISSYFGNGKAVFSPIARKGNPDDDNNVNKLSQILYFFWNNNKPYIYVYFRSYNSLFFNQGYLTTYQVCDYFNSLGSGNSGPVGCNTNSIVSEGDIELLKSFLNTITLEDYYYYYINEGNYTSPYLQLCMSSYELNQSVCFKAGCTSYSTNSSCQHLTGSLGLMPNLSFGDLSSFVLENPPSIGNSTSGTGDISSSPSQESNYTGAYTYYECTYNSLIDYAESVGYSPYLCRGGLSDFSTGFLTDISVVNPGTGKRLDEIYGYTSTSTQSAFEWFQYWQNVYQNPYVYTNSIWLNQPAVLRTYFSFYNQYGGVQWNFNDVYEYCLLKKFVSWNPTENGNTVYKGQYFKSTCEFLKNGGWDSYGGNGQHGVGTDWDGVGSFSGTTNQDGITFIQNFFNDLKANWFTFDKSELGLGFLPTYIIAFLLAIIFFRFLSH